MNTLSRAQPALPLTSSPFLPGFGVAGTCLSALEVGGDFYEVLPLSETSLLLAVADVMGKGLAASLFADSLRTLVRALAKPGIRPSGLLSEINQLMFKDLSSADMFITLQVVTADLFRRRLNIGNAGHCPLLMCDGSGHSWAVAPDGMPLGIQMDAGFCEESSSFPSFGAALLYTDGLTEARNSSGQFFGQDRLEEWFGIAVGQSQSAEKLRTNLLQRLQAFQEGAPARDDQTFLVLTDETPRTSDLWMNRATSLWPIECGHGGGFRPRCSR